MTAVNLSDLSAPNLTHPARETAGLTDMTDVLPFPGMTHDRSSLVPPHNARAGEGNRGPDVHPSCVSPRRPPWLYDGPLSDKVRLTSCPRCRRPVLEALADEVIPARIDLVRLTPAAELRHLLAGGITLRLWPDQAAHPRLAFRDASHISRHPGRGLPRHDCAIHHGPPDPTLLTHRRAIPTTEDPTW